jgi:drug/metabolite transporter (DMT)-like permease
VNQAGLRSPIDSFAPELAQFAVVMMWASTFVVTKAAFAVVSPLGIIFSRFLVMMALAFAVLLFKERGATLWIERVDLGRLVVSGLSGFTFYQLGFTLGLSHTSPFSSSLLIAMVPLITVLILAIMGEPTPRQGWVGLAVALVGVAIFLLDKRGAGSGNVLGDLLSLGAALSFAIYGIVNRPLVRKYPTATYSAWTLATGAIPLLLLSIPAANEQNWQALDAAAWLSILYLAILPVYVAYILWNFAIARRGVAKATTFSLLVPIVAGVLSYLLLGEPFGPQKLLGAALVMAGLVIVRLPGRAQEATTP